MPEQNAIAVAPGAPVLEGAGASSGFERVVSVLEHIGFAERALTHTEIAVALGVPKSTLTAILKMLRKSGCIDMIDRRYALGARMLAFSHKVSTVGNMALREALRPTIEKISRETGETAVLSVEVGGDRLRIGFVVAIDYVESPQALRYVSLLGHPRPIYDSAAGRALLAFSGRSLPAEAEYQRLSEYPADIKAVETELKLVRQRGYAVRVSPGSSVVSVGVALLDDAGWPVASISVTGPLPRIREDGANVLPALREAIQQTSGFHLA